MFAAEGKSLLPRALSQLSWGWGQKERVSLSATSENPSGVASALCYGSQGFPGSLGSLHLPAPQPCGGRSSGSSASTDLTAPLLLSHGINSWNQLPTAAGYMLKCKPHDWAENVAWVSPGAPLRNWELAGSGEASLGGQAFSTSLHLSSPAPPLFFLCSWSSSWPSSIWYEEILLRKLGGRDCCCSEASKGQEHYEI